MCNSPHVLVHITHRKETTLVMTNGTILKHLSLSGTSALTVLLIAHTQDDFRRPVVPRHHVGGHHEVGARCPG